MKRYGPRTPEDLTAWQKAHYLYRLWLLGESHYPFSMGKYLEELIFRLEKVNELFDGYSRFILTTDFWLLTPAFTIRRGQ